MEANGEFSLLTNNLLNQAIHSGSVLIRDRDTQYHQDFQGLVVTEDDAPWKSTVFLPLLPNFAATFTTRAAIKDNEDNRNYFELLRSLFSLYIHLLDTSPTSNSHRPGKSRESEAGKKLTERQELILSMIKSGMTNNAIANRMGYSESLIRQETMSIYQKLGVDGRREIIKNESLDESTNDENNGVQT